MSDLGLVIVDNCINLALDGKGSLIRDSGLETAILISLFTDKRVSASEVPQDGDSQRGWWADEFAEADGDEIGSKLWLFERGKINAQTAQAVQVRARQALEWMITDGVASAVEVTTSLEKDRIQINVSVRRPEDESTNLFSIFWDGQSVAR